MIVFAFLLGLIFGSFANVIVLRLNTGESLVTKGSRCFSCGRVLRWFEMIPVLSFVVLRARCRTCKSRISYQYPLVELGTGILFMLLFWHFGFGFDLSFGFLHLGFKELLLITYYLLLILAWFFLWIAALYDIRHMILPDRLLLFGFFFSIAAYMLNYSLLITHHASRDAAYQFGAGTAAFLFFFLLWFVSKGKWLGLGDAKYVLAFMPLFSPVGLIVGLMLSFFAGTMGGIFLFLLRGAGLKTRVPFGPFLFLGFLISYIAGSSIFGWYIGLFV